MALVKVYNDNIYPYREVFKEEVYEIPAGGFITMDKAKAIMFHGSFSPIVKNAQGEYDPKYFKKIRLEEISPEVAKPVAKFICQMDGKEFNSQKELDAWIDENHLDNLSDSKVAEDRRKKK